MKQKSILCCCVLAFVLFGCGKKEMKVDVVAEMYPEEQERVKDAVIHLFELAKAKQIDSVENYHLFGPKFTKFDDGPVPGRQDADSARNAERELFAAVSAFDYRLQDLKVDVFDDAAIATFIIFVDFTMGRMSGTANSRGTLVFVKVGEDWKITHEHFSPFGTPATP